MSTYFNILFYKNNKWTWYSPYLSILLSDSSSIIYFKALNESDIDQELLNFNYLNKNLIIRARSLLGEINKIQTEISNLKEKRNLVGQYDDDIIDKVLEYKSEIYDLSSRYFELIPKSHFKNIPVTPLDNENELKTEINLLENLL